MIYAGVGARSTPDSVLAEMRRIAQQRANAGWVLRSGGARGADSAFELGCKSVGGRCEIFSPNSLLSKAHYEIAEAHHPNWKNLSEYVKKLMARNAAILQGITTVNSQEVICWTPRGEVVGGTGHTIRMANTLHIPVRNLYFVAP